MSKNPTTGRFPSAIESKLRAVRLRHAGLASVRAVAGALGVLVGLMLVAIGVDWCWPFMDSSVRFTMTSTTVVTALVALLLLAIKPIATALGWNQAAGAVDENVPQLQERWSTIASLAGRDLVKQTPAEQAMARQVTSEAIAMERIVVPKRIAPPVSPKTAALAGTATLAVLGLAYLVSPNQMAVLLQRFWSPGSSITATQVVSRNGDALVPRGEKIELIAELNGVPRSSASLTIRDSDGGEETVSLTAKADLPQQFVHALRVDDSMRYRVRSGDGETAWHTLSVIDYPDVGELQLTIEFPAYTGREPVFRDKLPRRLKVVEGSRISLAIKPLEPVETFTVSLSAPKASNTSETPAAESEVIAASDDGWHRFEMPLLADVLLQPTMTSVHGLENERKLFSRIDVVADKTPVARVLSPTDEMAVSIDEVLEIEFEAHDDFGIARAELVIYDESKQDADGNPEIVETIEIPLGDQAMQKHVSGKTMLDLQSLNMPEGSEISYAVRVTDNRNFPMTASELQAATTMLAQRSNDDEAANNETASDASRSAKSPQSTTAATQDGSEKHADVNRKIGNELASQMAKLASPTSEKDSKTSNGELSETADPSSKMLPSRVPNSGDEMTADEQDGKSSESVASASNVPANAGESNDTKSPIASATRDKSNEANDRVMLDATKESTDESDPDEKDGGSTTVAALSAMKGKQNDETETSPAEAIAKANIEAAMSESSAKQESRNGEAVGSQSQQADSKDAADAKAKTEPQDSEQRNSLPRVALNGQQSTDRQQNTMTRRQRIRITEKLASVAKAGENEGKTRRVRESVVEINEMLAVIEEGLQQVVDRTIADSARGEQLRRLDLGLENVEAYVATLREETRETQYAFVGLQMVDITRTHVTPARDRVFASIQRPAAGDVNATESLKHVVRARELLSALLKRYDRVEREEKFKESLDDAITMYEVYVEKQRALLREAQQNRNPLDRKMEVIEVDQEYLDRLAEVIELRRVMLDEFAEMMGDDPRLLSRFLELTRRQSRSQRDQLSEISQRQYELTEESLGWLQIDETQRPDFWTIIVELRLNNASELAEDAADMAERIEKQMPLEIDPSIGTAADIVARSREITSLSRTVSFDSEAYLDPSQDSQLDVTSAANVRRLSHEMSVLSALLDRLLLEHEGEEAIVDYVQPRLLEVRAVHDQVNAWSLLSRGIRENSYARLVNVEQHQLAVDTQLLRVDMLEMRDGLAAQFQRLLDEELPEDIGTKIEQLHHVMESITFNQLAASWRCEAGDLEAAAVQQQLATERLETAEDLFDQIRRAVVEKLDEAEPDDPNIADLEDPTLDEFLAQLEREPNIAAQLGIPQRRRNLKRLGDSLTWGGDGVAALGNAGAAAEQRARSAMQMSREKRQKEQQNATASKEEEDAREQEKRVQEMLEKSLAEIEKQRDDPELTDEQRQKLEQLANDVRKLAGQSGNEPNSQRMWQLIVQSDQARAMLARIAGGGSVADTDQWNKLLSKLDDGLWQVRGKEPPEAYRDAIEQYQDQIRQLTESIAD